MKRFKTIGQNLALLALGCLLGLLAVEGLSRVIPAPYPIENSMAMGRLARSSPTLGVTIGPGTAQITGPEFSHSVVTRDLGCPLGAFRDTGEAAPGPRILALGDSFTWGAGVSNAETWPQQLETRLGAEVINMGYPGTGTRQQQILYNACAPHLDPDITLVAFFANDYSDTLIWREQLGMQQNWYNRYLRPVRVWLAAYSYTYQYLKYFVLGPLGLGDFQHIYWTEAEVNRRYSLVRAEGLALHLSRDYTAYFRPEFPLYEASPPLIQAAWADIAAQAERLDSRLLIIVLPTKEQVYWRFLEPRLEHSHRYQPTLPTDTAVQLARESGLPVLDLTPAFMAHNDTQLYWDVDGHMTAAGYRLIAETVAAHLREQGWLGR